MSNPALKDPERVRPPTEDELKAWRAEADRYPNWDLSVRQHRLVHTLKQAMKDIDVLRQCLADCPISYQCPACESIWTYSGRTCDCEAEAREVRMP